MKATEQNDKLRCAIILSIALHCILIAVLIWSSIHHLQETNVGRSSSSIGTVIVDPGAVVQQYNHQQQHNKQIQQKKVLKEQRIISQEAANAQQRLQADQQKQEEKVVKQAQVQKKQSEAAVVKQQAAESKQASSEAKRQAKVKVRQVVSQKKAADEAVKQSKEVNDLLGRLTDAKNMLKVGGELVGTDNSKQMGDSVAAIDTYKAIINNAIKNKFYDYTSYLGKTCDLHIKLGPDGILISVSASGGDPALCQAAISAAKAANIPRPPNLQVYKIFKNATLKFAPQ